MRQRKMSHGVLNTSYGTAIRLTYVEQELWGKTESALLLLSRDIRHQCLNLSGSQPSPP